MSDSITIARPYAKAIFEAALAAEKLSQWSKILNNLSIIVSEGQVIQFITNPVTTAEQHIELLMDSLPSAESIDAGALYNLIALLAHYKRLLILSDINVLFALMRAEQEKTLTVKVYSYSPLSADQQKQMISALKQRLKREVTLQVIIEKSLLGGAIIQAGDLVIDGSVRGKLNKLSTGLAA